MGVAVGDPKKNKVERKKIMKTPVYAATIEIINDDNSNTSFIYEGTRRHEIIYKSDFGVIHNLDKMPEELKNAITAKIDRPDSWLEIIDNLGYALLKDVTDEYFMLVKIDDKFTGWDSVLELRLKFAADFSDDDYFIDIWEILSHYSKCVS